MRRPTAFLIAGAVLLGGCGGNAAPSPPAAESTPGRSGTAVAEGDVRVAMRDFEFVPEHVTVERGQTITWVNEDTAQHDAVATEGGTGPRSELFNQGESYSWTAEEAGEIPYVCTVHPGMDGTITVR